MTSCRWVNLDTTEPHLACPFNTDDAPPPDSPFACPFWHRGIKCAYYSVMLSMRDERRKQELNRRMERIWQRRMKEFIFGREHLLDDYTIYESIRRREEREAQGIKQTRRGGTDTM